ncbi:MAG: hypothetical protein HYZ40_06970 [Rhodospirillales bacterium]|nr:hypothetical protein [Rhodospirillales bacterium]
MRNTATQHNGKDLGKEIAALKAQLEELAESVNGTGNSLLARGEDAIEEAIATTREVIDKYGSNARKVARDSIELKDRAASALVETTEARPLTTLAALLGIGFLAGYLCRRQ